MNLSTKTRSFILNALVAMLALDVTACVVAEPNQSPSTEPAATFTRTVVHVEADGTETVEQMTVTAAQQRTDQDERTRILSGEASTRAVEADLVTHDTGCAASSMWLFDQTGLAGNEICFYGSGYVKLTNYCRGGSLPLCLTWSKAVRSYWAGADTGLLATNSGPTCGSGGCYESFSAFQKALTVSACGQMSQYLGLLQLCIPG
jgi:hypothetical protein